MANNLPRWFDLPITQIAKDEKFSIVDGPFGSDLKLSDYVENGEVPVLTTKNLNGKFDPQTVRYITKEKFEQLKRSRIVPGDILIAKIGSVGKCSIYPEGAPTAIIPANLCKISVNERIVNRRFLLYQFKSHEFQNKIAEITSATAQPAFSVKRLKTLSATIPPLNEQHRIVAKLEKLLAKVDACKERLEKIPAILKRFRQSALAAACLGSLTSDLRNSPASKAENETCLAERGSELPTGWKDCSIRSLIQGLEQGWSPKCEIEPSHSDAVWAVIKTTAVQALAFDSGENKRLPVALNPRPKLELQQGDLLITRAGPRARAGVCCIVPKVRPRLIVCDKVYRFRANEKILGEFLAIALNSPFNVEFIDTLKTGISDSGVNLTQDKFQDIRVAVPPLIEQHEIVRRVEALFKIADDIEKRYEKAKAHVDKLTQSILAKAFRGELVPQDPNDEPASELLKRIQEERRKQAAEGRPGRRG